MHLRKIVEWLAARSLDDAPSQRGSVLRSALKQRFEQLHGQRLDLAPAGAHGSYARRAAVATAALSNQLQRSFQQLIVEIVQTLRQP